MHHDGDEDNYFFHKFSITVQEKMEATPGSGSLPLRIRPKRAILPNGLGVILIPTLVRAIYLLIELLVLYLLAGSSFSKPCWFKCSRATNFFVLLFPLKKAHNKFVIRNYCGLLRTSIACYEKNLMQTLLYFYYSYIIYCSIKGC